MEHNAPGTPSTPSTPDDNPIQDRPGAGRTSTVRATVGQPSTATPDRVSPDKVRPDKVRPDKVTPPARPGGPNASAIVLGLIAMVLAGLLIAHETMNLRVDWSRLGPGAIVGVGVVLAVIGAIGLIRRHDDV
ncbi:MAG TPA: hypothetical protein VF391_03985 [Dermatophilaceae bacterium]|jgi:hypothetical protein